LPRFRCNRARMSSQPRPRSAVALRIGGRPARSSRRRPAQRTRFSPAVAGALLLGALTSAVVLIVAEFMTLYAVRAIRGSAATPPVAAGTENYYALVPIALLALVLVVAAIRLGDRWPLVAVAILGLVALYIVLLHDLPDARQTGLVRSVHGGLAEGASSPQIGMYTETLGAVLLLITAGVGLLFGEPVAIEPSKARPERKPITGPLSAASSIEATSGQEAEPAIAVAPAGDAAPPLEEVVSKATATPTRKAPARKAPARKAPAKRAPAAKKTPAAKKPRASGSGATRAGSGSTSSRTKSPAAKGSSPKSRKPQSDSAPAPRTRAARPPKPPRASSPRSSNPRGTRGPQKRSES